MVIIFTAHMANTRTISDGEPALFSLSTLTAVLHLANLFIHIEEDLSESNPLHGNQNIASSNTSLKKAAHALTLLFSLMLMLTS